MAENITATPTNVPELTARSLVVGVVVAMIIGSAYPYCVLKLGFGPNLSVVSAFFGFIALVLMPNSFRQSPHPPLKIITEFRWPQV